MKILFLSLVNIVDIEKSSLYTDLLREFKKNGHSLYILSPLERRTGLKTSLTVKDDVNYLNIRVGNITKVNALEKGISTLIIENRFIKGIKKFFGNIKFDLVLYSTPPITFDKVIKFVKDRDNAYSYLLLKDIFPQNAVDLKMFSKHSLIYKYFRNKEKNLYNVSDYIGTMSPANMHYLISNNPYIEKNKVEICPNTITPKYNNFKAKEIADIQEKYSIPDNKVIYIYGGNIGTPQGIDFLLECLQRNENNENTFFLIIGTGTEYNKVKDFIENNNLKNSKLMNFIPKDEYEKIVECADVGLIFLDYRFTIPNFPSRLLSYMQAKIPVIAATDLASDIGKVIEDGQFGFWVPSNNVDSFNKAVLQMTNETKRLEMGLNGQKHLEKFYTSSLAYDIIMNHF